MTDSNSLAHHKGFMSRGVRARSPCALCCPLRVLSAGAWCFAVLSPMSQPSGPGREVTLGPLGCPQGSRWHGRGARRSRRLSSIANKQIGPTTKRLLVLCSCTSVMRVRPTASLLFVLTLSSVPPTARLNPQQQPTDRPQETIKARANTHPIPVTQPYSSAMAKRLSDRQKVTAAITISFAFFLFEIGVAFKTGSLALMADAFHYLSDIASFAVTLTAIIMSEKSQHRQDFSYGWQRARLLGGFFNGAVLLALGIGIFIQSVERFVTLRDIEHAKLVLITGCVGFGLNAASALFLHEHHHHHHHPDPDPTQEPDFEISSGSSSTSGIVCPTRTPEQQPSRRRNCHAGHRHVRHSVKPPGRDLGMVGAFLHVIGDMATNLGVILAAAVMWKTSSPARFYADPAIGMAIALLIFFSAVPLVRRSGEILLQSAPEGVKLEDIKHDIEKIPGVHGVHELHVWRLDQKKAVASAHILVSDPDVARFMETAETIRECLHAYGIHSTTLQPEMLLPVVRVVGGTPLNDISDPCQLMCGKGMCEHLHCCNKE
ncbi:cation efflux family-domain-containing protein [Chaetomium strumarium]|uniref:Cation efflux family-domain-containing protein n=1 Tax=Chaetomium strumarium TaxID=1170767 RepID=A0AAJ0GVX8_9PEZI|nr:cation efflux family-domain-containing protein [Chaetomium strumarium]